LTIELPSAFQLQPAHGRVVYLQPASTIPLAVQGLTLPLLETPRPVQLDPLQPIKTGAASGREWLNTFAKGLLILLQLQPARCLKRFLPSRA